ncbi:MAG: hypothetical protein AAF664_03030 [Planctomycetota bacterium]
MDHGEASSEVDQVELMMINARLRDELEPYRDEAIEPTAVRMTLQGENEYLQSILAWERAPALPIAQWFDPPLRLSVPESLDDHQLAQALSQAVHQLAQAQIFLRYTDHLDDRELYTIIFRDILTSCEKKVDVPGKWLEWRCLEDTATWLQYYASPVERRRYQEEHCVELPPALPLTRRRRLPSMK